MDWQFGRSDTPSVAGKIMKNEKWKKHAPEEGESQSTQFPWLLTPARISRSTYTRASKNDPDDILPVQNLDKALYHQIQ